MNFRSWKLALGALLLLVGSVPAFAANPLTPASTPPSPRFDRLHDYDEITSFLKGYAAAYPQWVKLESIGQSIQGRQMWLLTITNPATGAASTKPAMYVDGNTHANEVQGTEAVVYTIDFLLGNYGRLDRVTELLDRVTFYMVPMVNPDGRARWFQGPSTPDFPRTLMVPVDDDRDGRVDEDPYDDLDGNGVITQMRKKVPMGQGDYRLDPKDPRILVPVEKDEMGDYVQLGLEGIDNDGDGKVNEDMIGYVDPNRTWGYGWEPEYVQNGAGLYPFSVPETRSIATWALQHPNIAAVQSFHNYGRMILRGPGAKAQPAYPAADVKVYDLIGKQGEKMLPGYKYLLSWKDLYTTYGDTDAYFYRVIGALSFTNEMWEPPVDLDGDGKVTDQERMKFNDLMTMGRQFVDWKSYDHPQYGQIEIGGMRFDTNRVPEGWGLEEDVHRNSTFVMFNAYHLPHLSFGEPTVKKVDRDLYRVIVPVLNDRAMPSRLGVMKQENIQRPDIATVDGAKVIASGIVQNEWMDRIQMQKDRPERLMVPGVEGLSTEQLFFLVQGSGTITVNYDSLKAGKISKKIVLP